MKFSNRHNKSYQTEDGIVWASRSCAVVANLWCIVDGVAYALIGRRGPNMDHPNKLNMTCGYMDWDENGTDAVRRELFEETGLDITKFEYTFVENGSPWFVNTDPAQNRQNITLHYGIILYADSLPELSLDNMEPGESLGAFWKTTEEIQSIEKDEFAFNHQHYLEFFRNKYDIFLDNYLFQGKKQYVQTIITQK